MRRLFQNPLAKVLTLCFCLGVTGLVTAGCSSKAERAQAFYDRGIGYLEQKDYVKARIELRNAIQLKGDMLPAWKAMAEIDEHDQNLQALAGTLLRITELDSNDLPVTTKLARLYLLGNAPDRALKLANAAGELDPKNADVLALKAAVLCKLKDSDGATRAAQDAVAIEPGTTGANVILAAVKFSQGDANGAPHPDASAYAAKFSGSYEHRVITGGIGHNLPQEAPQEFANAVLAIGGMGLRGA